MERALTLPCTACSVVFVITPTFSAAYRFALILVLSFSFLTNILSQPIGDVIQSESFDLNKLLKHWNSLFQKKNVWYSNNIEYFVQHCQSFESMSQLAIRSFQAKNMVFLGLYCYCISVWGKNQALKVQDKNVLKNTVNKLQDYVFWRWQYVWIVLFAAL